MKNKSIVIEFSPKTILWVIATVVAIWFFLAVRDILIILFLAFIFAAAIEPFVNRLEKKRWPRSLAILTIYLAIIAIMALFLELIVPPLINQITQLVQDSGKYADTINTYLQNVNPAIKDPAIKALENIGNSISGNGSGQIVNKAFGFFSGAFGLIAVFVIAFYMLVQKNGVEKVLEAVLPKRYLSTSISVSRKISSRMSSWVRGQLFLALVIFLANYIALTILRVDMALTLAILSGILELLPIIGPIVAGITAALVALTVSPLLALIVGAWYILVQQLENHILVPQIMKKSVGLNPIIIIVAILVGVQLMGVWGALIAVPVVACISVIYEELKTNK
ncbi:MAG: AI-2E family transporter [Patescibacteria group bacterium]